jgi:hypothetical protein
MKVIDTVQISQEQLAERNRLLDAMADFYEDYAAPVPFGTPEKEGGARKTDLCGAILKADAQTAAN